VLKSEGRRPSALLVGVAESLPVAAPVIPEASVEAADGAVVVVLGSSRLPRPARSPPSDEDAAVDSGVELSSVLDTTPDGPNTIPLPVDCDSEVGVDFSLVFEDVGRTIRGGSPLDEDESDEPPKSEPSRLPSFEVELGSVVVDPSGFVVVDPSSLESPVNPPKRSVNDRFVDCTLVVKKS
jgi:hypothetical protein